MCDAISVPDKQVVALAGNDETKEFEYLFPGYPNVKSINKVSTKDFIDKHAFRHKKAPEAARWARGVYDIRKLGELLNDGIMESRVEVVFTDGNRDKKQVFSLTDEKLTYHSMTGWKNRKLESEVASGNFKNISRELDDNIGYLNIPAMFHPREAPGFESFIESVFEEFKGTKAFIIDVRNNGGGGREILNLIASYIIHPDQSPRVANVAYLRSDKTVDSDKASMTGRLLYTYNSEHFGDVDREAIDVYMEVFSPARTPDPSKFSVPFYMLLRSGEKRYTEPVYILTNERVFCAASVFVAAFKGLPNVTIAGVTTDGSSGNSQEFNLKNSNIVVKVSTMISYQRNGRTLDGNGTEPDIVIEADEAQVLWKRDTQLETLIRIINRSR